MVLSSENRPEIAVLCILSNKMNSFFRDFHKVSSNKRENAIKEALINTLSENAKEIQFEFTEHGRDYLELTDCTNSLCTTLEAIFLHGLKDSFLWQTMNVISGDVDRRPEPSFWSPLLVFLHKHIIQQLQSLSQITAEVGCCRSFIRLSLNESLFSSYLNNIRKNSSALNPYYRKYAFIKDSDYLELAAKILEGIESCIHINLPINSSLLNQWSNLTLQLAGIWTPPLRSCPIASGIDVANSLNSGTMAIPTPKPLQTNDFFAESISNSPFNQSILLGNSCTSDLTEHEHLQVLLQKVDGTDNISERNNSKLRLESEIKRNLDEQQQQSEERDKNGKYIKSKTKKIRPNKISTVTNSMIINDDNPQKIGNLVTENGWSSSTDETLTTFNNNLNNNNDLIGKNTNISNSNNNNNNSMQTSISSTVTTPSIGGGGGDYNRVNSFSYSRSDSIATPTSSLQSPMDRHSYNTLLTKHERTKQANWNDVWTKYENSLSKTANLSTGFNRMNPDTSKETLDNSLIKSTEEMKIDFSLITDKNHILNYLSSDMKNAMKIDSYSEIVGSSNSSGNQNISNNDEENSVNVEVSLNSVKDSSELIITKGKNNRKRENTDQTHIDDDDDATAGDNNDEDDMIDFEIVAYTMLEQFTLNELLLLVEQLCKLPRESGLNSQGFVCKSCSHPIGIGFATAHVCSFSGHYFCEKCMSFEQFPIPAKIIYNWDFKKYLISKRAAAFLLEFQSQPFIDFKILNLKIYKASDEMATLQNLRIKLNFIRAYLFTCRESIIEDLQKQVYSKEYLYEHIHKYSIADLFIIQKGTLEQLLQKSVEFGEQHILNCRLCKVKGFICEICNSPKVLYPFHIDTTYRCQACGAVFHVNCLNDSQPCPKCKRRHRREDLPLFEAVHML